MLDASAVLELLRRSGPGSRLAGLLGDEGVAVHVPHVMALEVTQGLRRLVRAGTLPAPRAGLALAALWDLDAVRHEHEPFLPRIWQLRENLTAYDAAYVALAEALDAPLLTLDARLAAAPGHAAEVELLG